jgi:hypothetical protein
MKFRISPSALESFRNYLVGNYELWGKTQADLKSDLIGVFTGNHATSLGTAVHAIIEGQEFEEQDGIVSYFDADMKLSWKFSDDAKLQILELRDWYKLATHELAIRKNLWLTDGTAIEMNMRIDALEGYLVTDFKTTKSKKSWKDYTDSIQWRCYCMALPEVSEINYVVLEFKHNDPSKVQTACIRRSYTYYPEPDNNKQVLELLERFIIWVKSDQELFDYFVQYEGEERDNHITKMCFIFPELVQKMYAGEIQKEKVLQVIEHHTKKYPELSAWSESLRKEIAEFV